MQIPPDQDPIMAALMAQGPPPPAAGLPEMAPEEMAPEGIEGLPPGAPDPAALGAMGMPPDAAGMAGGPMMGALGGAGGFVTTDPHALAQLIAGLLTGEQQDFASQQAAAVMGAMNDPIVQAALSPAPPMMAESELDYSGGGEGAAMPMPSVSRYG